MAEAVVANACMFISKKHMHTNVKADSDGEFMLSYLQFMCFVIVSQRCLFSTGFYSHSRILSKLAAMKRRPWTHTYRWLP